VFSVKRLGLLGLAAVALVALLLAACGDDDDDDGGGSADIQASLDRIEESLQRTQLTTAMTTYRAEGLHELDGEVVDASEIGAGWSGTLDRLHAVTMGTDWPDDMTEMAATLGSELALAIEAIDADDLAATKEHVGLAHAAWHNLEHDAYAAIGGEVSNDGHDDAAEPTGHANGDNSATPMSSGMTDDGHSHMDMGTVEIADGDPVPTVELIVHEDPKAGWNLQIVTTNFAFAPSHASMEHVAGEGHAHLYVDDVKIGRVYGEWFHLASLEPGDHEVRIALNANDHRALSAGGELIEGTVMIHVADGS
jgi:hypothetical protein